MVDLIAELLSIVAPVYVCAGLGYLWTRSGRRYDSELVTELIFLIGAPCLIFSTLVDRTIDRDTVVRMATATVLALSAFFVLAFVLLRVAGLPRRGYLPALIFGNSGNLGLPVCLFAFGDRGLALGACYFATSTLMHFTVGLWLWSGRISFRQLYRTPLVYGVVLASLVLAFDVSVPRWIRNTTDLLGSFTVPLMAFTLGVTLGRLGLGNARRSLFLAAARMPIAIGIAVAIAAALGFEGVARGVLIIDCSMPPAVFGFLMAQKYDRGAAEVASLVVVSTLFTLATLPVLLGFILHAGVR